jgi:5-(carboxyamino)imidazole ribonucleotide mutase
MSEARPLVGVIMGSRSDWETMREADEILTRFGVPHECRIVSAHRTPTWMAEYASTAAARGLEVIVAGAGGAAHLPGMVAAHTVLPVIGVPVHSAALGGLDSLLSIVQMPKGVPVATVAIGAPGAVNAALLAVAILGNSRPDLRTRLYAYRQDIAAAARSDTLT